MDFEKIKMQCECSGSLQKMNTLWKGISVRGWKCNKCKEEIIHPADAQNALEIDKARKKNKLKVKIRRVGKSDVITIPSIIKKFVHLKSGQELEWNIKENKLFLTY